MLRVTLKGLRGHLTRFVSTFVAILLGIGFLAGTFVLSDTIKTAFNDLFADVNRGTDAFVRSTDKVSGIGPNDDQRKRLDETLLPQVAAVPGVEAADATVMANDVHLIDKKGKVIGDVARGAPHFGTNWITTPALNPWHIADGAPPTADGDLVIDRNSANKGGFHVGDAISVELPVGTPQLFHISGIATFGTADSPLGASFALMTLPEAQRTLAEPGKVDGIKVQGTPGIPQAELASRIQHQMPPDVETLTGSQLTKEDQDRVQQIATVFTFIFGAFAGIAVLVGGFVIYNTFSIIIAQRTKELALLRAIGASRRQVLLSVGGEALIVGAVASVLGIFLGLAIAAALKALFAAFGFNPPAAGLVLSPTTVIVSLLVGVIVTMVAALVPAIRAGRVPPIAAMRDVAVEKTAVSKRRVAFGVALVAVGIALLLNWSIGSGEPLPALGGGLLALIGTVVLGPVAARPATSLLGAPARAVKGVVGNLASENSMRNPRRTAGTASALLVGVGVVALLTVVFGSFRQSIDDQISRSFVGDVTVSSGNFGRGGISPTLTAQINQLPEVSAATPLRFTGAEVNGGSEMLAAVDPATVTKVVDLDITAGDITQLGPDEIAVLDTTAADKHWTLGHPLTVRFAETGEHEFRIGALFHRNDLTNGSYLVGTAALDANVPNSLDSLVFVKFKPGVPFEHGRAAVEGAAKPYAAAKVQDQSQLKATYEAQISQFFALMLVMLALSIVIALMGIANTLRLSVYERTREIGLLRAVGMTRTQVRSSLRWESAIIALFGTIGGLAIGVFFGWVVVHGAGRDQDVVFAPPVRLLLLIVVLGGIAGVIAAVRPAARAAKLDVLTAIATE